MGRFFLGVLTPIALILIVILGLWVSDLLGFVQINDLALDAVGLLPGMKTVKDDYELGKERSVVLQEKEDQLRGWESKLKTSEAKLKEDTAQFENEKLEWEKQHLLKTDGPVSPKQAAAPGTADLELKKYLSIIGGMKPEKAAAVVQQLPEDTVLLLLKQLRPSQAAKILENLPPEYVVHLTKKRITSSNS